MSVSARVAEVRERVAAACTRVGRNPQEVRTCAVTKTHAADVVQAAIDAGADAIGENRVQEAAAKRPAVTASAPWHLVGPLQRNKAAAALGVFDVIETVDRPELATRLEALLAPTGRIVPVFLELNVGGEGQKSGVTPAGAPELVEVVLAKCPHLALQGVMTVPPYDPDPERSRRHFAALRASSDQLAQRFSLGRLELSMGMSEDFTVAVEEGATWIRLGRVLFGERPART